MVCHSKDELFASVRPFFSIRPQCQTELHSTQHREDVQFIKCTRVCVCVFVWNNRSMISQIDFGSPMLHTQYWELIDTYASVCIRRACCTQWTNCCGCGTVNEVNVALSFHRQSFCCRCRMACWQRNWSSNAPGILAVTFAVGWTDAVITAEV